jgi:hypothetical protein
MNAIWCVLVCFLSSSGPGKPPVDETNPPALIQLHNGRLCLTYGSRAAPSRIYARLSDDGGRTWSEPMALREDDPGRDIGYPRGVERPDGKVVTIFASGTARPVLSAIPPRPSGIRTPAETASGNRSASPVSGGKRLVKESAPEDSALFHGQPPKRLDSRSSTVISVPARKEEAPGEAERGYSQRSMSLPCLKYPPVAHPRGDHCDRRPIYQVASSCPLSGKHRCQLRIWLSSFKQEYSSADCRTAHQCFSLCLQTAWRRVFKGVDQEAVWESSD